MNKSNISRTAPGESRDRLATIGIIGLGPRAETLLASLLVLDDVEVGAVCDLSDKAVAKILSIFKRHKRRQPKVFKDYHDLLGHPQVDAVLVPTSWNSHLPIAIDALEAGKYVGIEVGGASSLDELWRLVHACERTRTSCMMLENCCYGRNELMVLNMVRQGLFGEIVHCAGGYEHDLRDGLALQGEAGSERAIHNRYRNADLYPTHQLGPIAKLLRINRGNRFLSLTSTASKSRGLQDYARRAAGRDVAFAMGDVVTTVITCAGGETIALTHSVSLPRPYSRNGRVQGTRGIWLEDANGIYIDGVSPSVELLDPAGNPYTEHHWDPVDKFYSQYDHPLWKEYHKEIVGGHGGMDALALSAFLDAARRRVETPIDAYDVAAWMAVTCLSEQSIAMGGHPVPFPDFTNGKWIRRSPLRGSAWTLDEVPSLEASARQTP